MAVRADFVMTSLKCRRSLTDGPPQMNRDSLSLHRTRLDTIAYRMRPAPRVASVRDLKFKRARKKKGSSDNASKYALEEESGH